MTAVKTTAQVFGLFGLLATAISLGFTAADVAAQEVAPKVMTAGEAVYTENCAHCHKATGQCDGGGADACRFIQCGAICQSHKVTGS
jgi:mono/diheme cytochrome c family protein